MQDQVSATQQVSRTAAASVCMMPVPKHQPTQETAAARATIATTFFIAILLLAAFSMNYRGIAAHILAHTIYVYKKK